jgi:hypothetical protein
LDFHTAIQSQYLAALGMLEQAVRKCPTTLWTRASDTAAFWNVAYHALFYLHLYVSSDIGAFVVWEKHRDGCESLAPQNGEPYSQADILDYAAFCRLQIERQVPKFDLAGPSGFDWMPMRKFEHQIYVIRHVQQHAGELMERLGSHAGISVDWITLI